MIDYRKEVRIWSAAKEKLEEAFKEIASLQTNNEEVNNFLIQLDLTINRAQRNEIACEDMINDNI